jgi:hypothetical protein
MYISGVHRAVGEDGAAVIPVMLAAARWYRGAGILQVPGIAPTPPLTATT